MNLSINVGFYNFVPQNKILAILDLGTLPIKRILDEARRDGRLVDVTRRKRAKTLILLEGGIVICSPLRSTTLSRRFNSGITSGEDDED